jgi:hypothetical protein
MFSNNFYHIRLAAAVFCVSLAALVSDSHAQFSKTVVVLKGVVRAEETGNPVSVKVSVRPVNDTALEVTSSRSNSETGGYLVILKPGKKYWVHLESATTLAKDTLVEAPMASSYTQIVRDFTVQSQSGAPLPIEASNVQLNVAKLKQ